jgi:hypothetical protein
VREGGPGGGEELVAGVNVVGIVVSSHLIRSSSIFVCNSRSHAARSARWVTVSESFADSAAASRVRSALVSSWAEARSDSRSLSFDLAASRSASKDLHLRFWAVSGDLDRVWKG